MSNLDKIKSAFQKEGYKSKSYIKRVELEQLLNRLVVLIEIWRKANISIKMLRGRFGNRPQRAGWKSQLNRFASRSLRHKLLSNKRSFSWRVAILQFRNNKCPRLGRSWSIKDFTGRAAGTWRIKEIILRRSEAVDWTLWNKYVWVFGEWRKIEVHWAKFWDECRQEPAEQWSRTKVAVLSLLSLRFHLDNSDIPQVWFPQCT